MSTPFKMTGFSGFGNSPMKQAKNKKTYTITNGNRPKTPERPVNTEVKSSEIDTLKKTDWVSSSKSANKIAKESVVIPEIEIKAKKPETRYTTADLNNANREQKGAIMWHARKNKYKIGGKTAKLTTQ